MVKWLFVFGIACSIGAIMISPHVMIANGDWVKGIVILTLGAVGMLGNIWGLIGELED